MYQAQPPRDKYGRLATGCTAGWRLVRTWPSHSQDFFPRDSPLGVVGSPISFIERLALVVEIVCRVFRHHAKDAKPVVGF